MKRALELFILVALATLAPLAFEQSSAQQKLAGNLAGTVVDRATHEPLVGVYLIVVGTKLGAATDLSGHFQILNLAIGKYTVRISDTLRRPAFVGIEN